MCLKKKGRRTKKPHYQPLQKILAEILETRANILLKYAFVYII